MYKLSRDYNTVTSCVTRLVMCIYIVYHLHTVFISPGNVIITLEVYSQPVLDKIIESTCINGP